MRHPVITALGATTIVLMVLLGALASPSHNEFYHLIGPVRAVVVPVLLNFATEWLVLTLLLAWGRSHQRFNSWVWSVVGIGLSWKIIVDWYVLHDSLVPVVVKTIFLVGVCLIFFAWVAWRSRVQPILYRARQLALPILGFVALSGLMMIAQAVLFSWQARHLNAPRPLHQRTGDSASSARHGRIIWILFDELSYRQVYEHRYQGLDLPAFTQLARTATVFTHTVPSGVYTEQVLPSLIAGHRYDGMRASAAGWPLEVHNRSTGTWETFDPHKTVFQDALDAGYSTAIAGWYNPYCRILPEVLDRCFWTNHTVVPGDMFPERSILWNSEQPIIGHLVNLARSAHLLPRQNAPSTQVRLHQQDYRELAAAGDELLRDSSADFILLHMPIPHPGGIYNRYTGNFEVSHPSYIDNLALCDVYLAHVRRELEENGTWNNSTLVIMGDHSWRVNLFWAKSPEWTEEERIASDNVTFDDRPAYLVKLPGQTTPAHIDEPFESIRTRELFDKLLTGQIETPEQLSAWSLRP
ncbi:sulfatase-like hydrolase/transferase [Tunturibacter empetritectus]|uniref:Sulfatase N-terminal domain-containing protein n=1 Tax=Tunturiibacter lichenicola TaxID=2051959 RepID=A0A7W8N7G1_9BACT|nr:sulfatase-like hydrolase/transferase [Edaphobacter lichenicola]MBB5346010.1 hypothetical protein [Edaphobacter lichenicola]